MTSQTDKVKSMNPDRQTIDAGTPDFTPAFKLWSNLDRRHNLGSSAGDELGGCKPLSGAPRKNADRNRRARRSETETPVRHSVGRAIVASVEDLWIQ
ncbi:hypothetical protein CCMA1212_010406 [Trichoderma ghanense]|uniref:Uncharacterized protein n=1 Tax=Trichoderma ghanense TaxID=65468 RepID=A0ABY2GPQ8_9HYPO